ncbi:hypothetical protein PCA31118_02025 [Pandoraea captiosa]|uniref:Lipoprotein n=1 Tax=Pandoraea captiosa TaxID=2508302 RepID=A0A5E4ZWW3_9BURK|nr:hypothetical protein [Pandoraea captiosa]VVE65476.1 hypothetical protein PCA31118_02025 [Pandoraea captiosa]
MYRLRFIAALALALLLSACGTPMRVSMTPEQRSKITELTAHVVVVQDEVIAAVQPSNAASIALGGGLIGAIIDSKVTNSRVNDSQQLLGPFYAAIEDVDYRKEFNESIAQGLSGYAIKVGKITTTPRSLTGPTLARLRNELQPGQALLIIIPRYTLTMDFRSFDSESVVSIWVKSDGSNTITPAQRGVLHYQSALIGPGGKASLALWGAQNGAKFREIVRESIAETVRMVMLDIEIAEDTATKTGPVKTFSYNTGASVDTVQGTVLKEGDARAIVLGADKKLYSLPNPGGSATVAQK